jgi:hypothetical protein
MATRPFDVVVSALRMNLHRLVRGSVTRVVSDSITLTTFTRSRGLQSYRDLMVSTSSTIQGATNPGLSQAI